MTQSKDQTIKLRVGFFGSGSTGKTQLVNALAYRSYSPYENPTAGRMTDSCKKEDVLLTFTHHGGSDQYAQFRSMWVQPEQINVICIDQSDKKSLEQAHYYMDEIKKKKPDSHIIIALTKTDLGSQVTKEDIKKFQEKHNLQDVKVIGTSAMNRNGIDELRDFIARHKDKKLIEEFKEKVDAAREDLNKLGTNSHSEIRMAMDIFQAKIAEASKESSKIMVQKAIREFTSKVTEDTLKVEPAKVRDWWTKFKEMFTNGLKAWDDTPDEMEEKTRYKGRMDLKDKLASYKDEVEKDSSRFKP